MAKTALPKPHVTLDMTGLACPGPLLGGMRKGEVLRLVSSCAGIRADLRNWSKATGHELVDAREIAPGEYQFHIRKR